MKIEKDNCITVYGQFWIYEKILYLSLIYSCYFPPPPRTGTSATLGLLIILDA